MTESEPRDPFALTADTRLYVARAATENALDALRAALDAGGQAVALTGPAGLGKTLLLHLLAERSRERWRAVYLPYASLSPEDLSAWVIAALDTAHAGAPAEALLAAADGLEPEGQGLLLLLDDAGALPIETARWLGPLAAGSEGRLALAVAASDHAGAAASLAALGCSATVRLSEPMDDRECAEYVRARLGRTRVPERVQERFAAAAVRRLHAISGGNPRRLHIAASDLLRGGSGQVPEDQFETADDPAAIAAPGGPLENS